MAFRLRGAGLRRRFLRGRRDVPAELRHAVGGIVQGRARCPKTSTLSSYPAYHTGLLLYDIAAGCCCPSHRKSQKPCLIHLGLRPSVPLFWLLLFYSERHCKVEPFHPKEKKEKKTQEKEEGRNVNLKIRRSI